MNAAPAPRRGVRIARGLVTAALAFAAISCLNDRPSGPASHLRASFHLQPVGRGTLTCGPLPVIHPASARVLLRQAGHTDSTVFTGTFVNDSVTLTVDVALSQATELLDIDAQAIDAGGDTVFRARDTVTAHEGERSTVSYLKLWYSAPDSALTAFSVLPRDTSIRYAGVLQMRQTGLVANTPFTGTIRLSFLSRDPTIATTTASGAVTAQSKTGTTWLVATTWLGLCDSTTISAIPPVATVTLTPDTVDVVRDGTVRIVAVLKDAAGNQLFGRHINWTSSNGNASVDTTGLVKGLIKGAVRITAVSEGMSASAGIGILAKPVAKVTISPKPLTVNIAMTSPLTAVAYDAANVVNPDWPVAWASLHPTIATVSTAGAVTGVVPGTDTVTATANGVADSAVVIVQTAGITSTVVTPSPDSLFSLNDSLALTVKSYTGAVLTAGTYTWLSRDATVATVTTSGLTVAKGNGTTYVVVIETGGTKDSAKVTVAQRAAAITLSPTPVQRYLGTVQTFVAAATDARGNAIASAVFTWTVSDPSVASITTGGVATMLALGIDTVKATIGAVVGKAALTVKPVITKILVAPSPPGTGTLSAIGRTQNYGAVAHDTLDQPMTGVTFTWASTNPSVATIPGTPGTTQMVTAAANGNTAIQATAQGVTGGATLVVSQVLYSILAGPNPDSLGPGGTGQLTARGQDSALHFISGGSFTWTSGATSVVTVGATTGIISAVVGVPLPSSAKIWATSGTIVSDTVLVTVSNAVPKRVSWGHDTLTIGRGTLNNSIPVYLSTAPASPITVTLAVRDTFAYFSPASVTFAAGQVSANATLNGRNAGLTLIMATENTGLYSPDTSVLLVQASSHLTSAGYSLNASDFTSTQVLLTDPAPAGGVYLTFNYTNAAIAQVSPDPAFIPAGQLAGNVNINGLAAGSTQITPGAPGVAGTATTATVYASKLTWSISPRVTGAGQQDQDYVYTPTTMQHSLTVALASKDSTIARSVASVTIPAGSNIGYFYTTTFRAGLDSQFATVSGWTTGARAIVVTTPHVGICCGINTNTTGPQTAMTVYAEDSIGTAHARVNPLFVTVSSSDSNIIKVIDTLVTIPAGSQSIVTRMKPGGNGGTAYIRVVAGGHTSDSMIANVSAPALGVSFPSNVIGAGQSVANYGYVSIPNTVTSIVPVTITSSDPTVLTTTSIGTIPIGSNIVYYNVQALKAGRDTLHFSAPGYSPAQSVIVVSTPRLGHCCNGTYNNFAPDVALTVYTEDSLGNVRTVGAPVRVTISPNPLTVVTTDSSAITVAANTGSNNAARVHLAGLGAGTIVLTAPGYRPDTATYQINMPTLQVSAATNNIGLRQHVGPTGAYIAVPNVRAESVIVHIANPHKPILGAPDSVKIPAGNVTNIGYFDYKGLAIGKDTLTYTATGYSQVISALAVTPAQLRGSGLSATYNTTSPAANLFAYAMDTLGNVHYNMDTLAVRLVSSDTTVLKVDSPTVHMPIDRQTTYVSAVRFVGPGSAKIYLSDSAGVYRSDSTVLVTVVGPVLAFSSGSSLANPQTLGMRQHLGATGMYVNTPNTVTGSPVVITLVSTDPTVLTVPATVTIPVGNNIGYFDAVAHDTTGTIQIKATAVGYGQAVSYFQVGRPQFLLSTATTATSAAPPGTITVYAADQIGNARAVTENVTVALASTNPAVATPDSATITILKDGFITQLAHMHYLTSGTTILGASDPRTNYYRYDSATSVPVLVNTPQVCLSLGCVATITLGLNEYVTTYAYVNNAVGALLPVTLTHQSGLPPTVAANPASLSIAATQTTSVTDTISGTAVGGDLILTSATGYLGGTVVFAVDSGMIALSNVPASMNVGDSVAVTLYTQDVAGNYRSLVQAVTFTLASDAGLSFSQGNQPITSVTVPAHSSSTTVFYLKATATGVLAITINGGTFRIYTNGTTVQ